MTKKNDTILLDEKPCWRKNGVWGDETPRCEKLSLVSHCRSCSVFEAAAKAAVFENSDSDSSSLSIDDLIRKQRLEGDQSILPFRLGSFCLAVPTSSVVTISDHAPIHMVPFNRNTVIKGVVAINHEIYTFVNFSKLLSIPSNEMINANVAGTSEGNVRGLYKRILVIDFNSQILSFYVDEVFKIYRYYQQAVNEAVTHDFLGDVSNGSLLQEQEWCGDCHIISLENMANKFENTFI